MEKLSNWDNEEVKTLFKFVEIKKSEGLPLIKIFEEFANCTCRQKNSVRNYYYKELSSLQKNNGKAKKLGIVLENHVVNKGIPFSKEEERSVLEEINTRVENGYSVRKACFELSNGDVPTMLRLQNKYRALTKNKEHKKSMGQIIKMPIRSNCLSDEDIKALFLGLVKLVKKQEFQNAKTMYEKEIVSANEKLRKAVLELAVKQKQIEDLQGEISIIKDAVLKQQDTIIKKRVDSLNKNIPVASKLKEYFDKKQSKLKECN